MIYRVTATTLQLYPIWSTIVATIRSGIYLLKWNCLQYEEQPTSNTLSSPLGSWSWRIHQRRWKRVPRWYHIECKGREQCQLRISSSIYIVPPEKKKSRYHKGKELVKDISTTEAARGFNTYIEQRQRCNPLHGPRNFDVLFCQSGEAYQWETPYIIAVISSSIRSWSNIWSGESVTEGGWTMSQDFIAYSYMITPSCRSCENAQSGAM